MKITTPTLIAVVWCLGPFADSRAESSKGINFSANFVAQITPEIWVNDLEVRDADNRLVSDSSRQLQLQQLFLTTIYELLAVAHPHSMGQALDSVSSFIALFLKGILHCPNKPSAALQTPLLPPRRGFVHIVYNLWITLTVGISSLLCLIKTGVIFKPSRPLPLRC